MDGFNVQRDNKTRDVVVNTEKLEGGQEFNVKREAPKVVPDIGLDLIINKKKEGSQGTRTDSDTETDSINISRGNIPPPSCVSGICAITGSKSSGPKNSLKVLALRERST